MLGAISALEIFGKIVNGEYANFGGGLLQHETMRIDDVKILSVARHADERGCFCETFRQDKVLDAGIETLFVQDNYSISVEAGTLRGLHFQIPPFTQAKLVTVLHGAIYDVAVDLRQRSPTYGQHVGIELSAENGLQMFVPRGFAHGFLTLEPNTQVVYKVDSFYAPQHDCGCAWNDPDLSIPWPEAAHEPILSDKDRRQPRFSDLPHYFD